MPDAVLIHDLRAELAEGPVWSERRQRLLFVDINRGHVHEFDPVTGHDVVVDVGETVGAVACAADGSLVVAAGVGFARIVTHGHVIPLARAAPGRKDVRMNDGYVDARGRFWAGTMSLTRTSGAGTLYRLDPDLTVREMLGSVTTSNGIDWSPDNKLMYYADTGTGRVDQFDFDLERGGIGNRRTFVSIPPEQGRPDGVIVDANGGVWVACWAGGAVRRFTAAGALDTVITVPATNVTKCAFGGPEFLDLYITTARRGLTAEQQEAQPYAGGIFRARPGVGGKPPHLFGG